VASAPASLAHDLLRSMGKHLPPTGSDDGTYWTGNTETAWRALAAWTLALRTGHLIVTRAHRISSRHFEYLFALRELTRIRLTLLCHGPLPPALATALATLRHEEAHTLAAAHRAFTTPAPPPPTSRFAWWEAGEQFPPREGEPCFLLPTRRTPGRGVIEAAARRLGRTVLPLPAARCPLPAARCRPTSRRRSSRTGSTRVSPIPFTPRHWQCASSPAARPHNCSCPQPTRPRRPYRTMVQNTRPPPGRRT